MYVNPYEFFNISLVFCFCKYPSSHCQFLTFSSVQDPLVYLNHDRWHHYPFVVLIDWKCSRQNCCTEYVRVVPIGHK